MQKSILLTISLFALAATSLVLSSCSKDDDDPKPPELSFFDEDMTVDENDGTIQVRVVLSKSFSKPIAIDYDVEGTAIEGSSANSDYEISGSFGEVVIEAGDTEAIIQIEIKDDQLFEGDETIELTIEDVSIEDVVITGADKVTITLEDNDEQPTVSFSETSITMDEAEASGETNIWAFLNNDEGRVVEIEVVLDGPAGKDITVTYKLDVSGDDSAVDSLLVYGEEASRRYYDYAVNSETASYSSSAGYTTGEIVIPAGETSANIELRIWSDFLLENDETITINLMSATDGVGIGTDDVFEFNLPQEDGLAVGLAWDYEDPGDVDLDMIFWQVNEENEPIGLFDIAATSNDGELVFVPAWMPDGKYGLSYPYWAGTDNSLEFESIFADFANGQLEPLANRDFYSATYTLANINEWDDETNGTFPTAIVQTFEIEDGAYINVSDIIVPTEGSRRPAPGLINNRLSVKAGTLMQSKSKSPLTNRFTGIKIK